MDSINPQVPSVALFVTRSEIDFSHRSPSPICQRWFMVLYLKSEAKELALTVYPVNMKNPEQEFKKAYNSNPPVVVFNETNDKSSQVVLTDSRDIEVEISKCFPVMNMNSLKEAEDVCSNVYIKFHPYLKSSTGDQQEQMKLRSLLTELKRINDYLEETGSKFLSGNEMTFIDCDIMPKLQHIRIAGKYYKNLDIPNELRALWLYMERCYQSKAFQESCPFDQDILMHYEGKVAPNHKPFGKTPTLQQPTMTLTIPE
ncbi:unnamed protein product [Adineta steineri]|uniref:CLIC N-terminal domain-containing protein n=1 Tax=Adineta steineri TaxID=433720 RepID=A0A818PFW6_9BILA|nr:unnamed protein product [Adineta steineri]CAF1111208.1 unnamed protein product [Adineta steineri]CAF3594662.1 unnamed protein product [Adineta steineri]CAF3619401.1 unnamed protein product [Adineta steineri]CAF4177817.1 unnamed protein product [Adineta steineri]